MYSQALLRLIYFVYFSLSLEYSWSMCYPGMMRDGPVGNEWGRIARDWHIRPTLVTLLYSTSCSQFSTKRKLPPHPSNTTKQNKPRPPLRLSEGSDPDKWYLCRRMILTLTPDHLVPYHATPVRDVINIGPLRCSDHFGMFAAFPTLKVFLDRGHWSFLSSPGAETFVAYVYRIHVHYVNDDILNLVRLVLAPSSTFPQLCSFRKIPRGLKATLYSIQMRASHRH
jgi:hypothetical protein